MAVALVVSWVANLVVMKADQKAVHWAAAMAALTVERRGKHWAES